MTLPLRVVAKSGSVNLFRTVWVCNIFSLKPIPNNKRKKKI